MNDIIVLLEVTICHKHTTVTSYGNIMGLAQMYTQLQPCNKEITLFLGHHVYGYVTMMSIDRVAKCYDLRTLTVDLGDKVDRL